MTYAELVDSLSDLRLKAMKQEFGNLARIAEKEQSTYEQYLYMLTNTELEHRLESKVRRLKKEAKLPVIKDLEQYDYSNIQGITAKQIGRLATGQFIENARNVVFFGTFGVGKTHLAIGLIQKLCESGYRCLFITTSTLIESLQEAKQSLTLTNLWRRLDRYDLIVCDELGYIPQTREGADLFFQFISQRYERKSILITTNLTYSEWDKVFLNETTTAAAVDRVIHKCETYNIQGPSKRREEALKKMDENDKNIDEIKPKK